MKRLKGAFALVFLFEGEEDLLIGARRGSPLAVGFGPNGAYLGSDALALAPFATEITYLDEDDWVELSRERAVIRNAEDAIVERARRPLQAGSLLVDKGNYRHYMAKEIHEQPEVVGRALAHYLDLANGTVRLPFELPFDPKALDARDDLRLRHGLLRRPRRALLARALRAPSRSTSTSPPSSATARRRSPRTV